jgi:hypothetical protein
MRKQMNQPKQDSTPYWIAAGVSVSAALLFVGHQFIPSLHMDVIGLSLIGLAMVPWLVPLLRRHIESVKVLGHEVRFLTGKVEKQDEMIKLIYEAMKGTLTQYELNHLVELESDHPVLCQYGEFLSNEMIRLCQHGYASETFEYSTWKMKDKGAEMFDLKQFYKITDKGRRHLALLRELGHPGEPPRVKETVTDS